MFEQPHIDMGQRNRVGDSDCKPVVGQVLSQLFYRRVYEVGQIVPLEFERKHSRRQTAHVEKILDNPVQSIARLNQLTSNSLNIARIFWRRIIIEYRRRT